MTTKKSVTYADTTDGISFTTCTDGICRTAEVESEKIYLHLLFYVAENYSGKNMFEAAAKTREQNINKKHWDGEEHLVYIFPILRLDEILEITANIKQKSGTDCWQYSIAKVAEIGVFSHAGTDGPIVYDEPVNNKEYSIVNTSRQTGEITSYQMTLDGWNLMQIDWTKDAKCVFYGCNTAKFAQKLSKKENFKKVEVWGQSASSYPSFYPDVRVTNKARNDDTGWNIENTYMVASYSSVGCFACCEDNGQKSRLLKIYTLKAQNMNCYKNGELIKASHQGVFNDHRQFK